jgi:hypothetical protein
MASYRYLIIAGVLMILLGIARGIGGTTLLAHGATSDPAIEASTTAIILVGAVLVLLGIFLIAAALGVMRGNIRSWRLGIVLTVAFVIDAAVNGAVLYGRPGAGGTLANVIAAVLIVTFLMLGRGALRKA